MTYDYSLTVEELDGFPSVSVSKLKVPNNSLTDNGDGSVTLSTGGGGSGTSIVVLASDVVNNNAVANTIQDVTGLSFPVTTGTLYYFYFHIWYTSEATTTGSRWSISGPTNDILVYWNQHALSATSNSFNNNTAYDLPANSKISSARTAGNIAFIEGWVRPTADGNIIARFASGVANSAITAKAGSFVEYREII